mmetsp:Transcript_45525/g.118166  ORF Transcript_45525/g.118166 Transcript_45525/m.118166 type:complete len:257 (+) Transcript_45525:349-1119(+)
MRKESSTSDALEAASTNFEVLRRVMLRKSWTDVTTTSFDFASRFTKTGFSTASGRAMSTSIKMPSDTELMMPSDSMPLAPTRACAFLIIASLARRMESAFARRSFSLAILRWPADWRRFSASRRSSFMASVASLFAVSIAFCLSLNKASANLTCVAASFMSDRKTGMISSMYEVAFSSQKAFLGLVRRLVGLLPSSIRSSSSSVSSMLKSSSWSSPRIASSPRSIGLAARAPAGRTARARAAERHAGSASGSRGMA